MSSAPSEGGVARSKEPPAKPKGKPETGTLRKEPKREAKREEPKREEPKKRDASPEEKIISRRKRHDSDEDSDASSGDSEVSTASSTVKRVYVEKNGEKEKNGAPSGDVEGEDTMANL